MKAIKLSILTNFVSSIDNQNEMGALSFAHGDEQSIYYYAENDY